MNSPPSADFTTRRRAELSLFAITVVWATTFTVVKRLSPAMDPVAQIFYRFIIATALLGAWLAVKRARVSAGLRDGVVLGLLMWLGFVTQMIGLRTAEASSAALITGMFVVFTPLFAYVFFRVRPGAWRLFAVALSLCGLRCITGGIAVMGIGEAWTLASAAVWGAYIALLERYSRRSGDRSVLAFQQFAVVTVMTPLWMAATGVGPGVLNLGTVLGVVYLGVFATLISFVVQTRAQAHTDAVRAALIFAAEPALGAGFAWTFGGETPTTAKIAGAALVVAAVAVSEGRVSLRRRPESNGRPWP